MSEPILFPNAAKRAAINEMLAKNQQALDSSIAANKVSRRQQDLWALEEKIAADEAERKAKSEGFKLDPYGTQIRMKDAEDLSNRKGYYASFTELANEFVRQNKGNGKKLDAFKRMNPFEQRDFLAKNLEAIFEKGGDSFLKVYNDAMNKAGTSERAFQSETFKNLQRERDYLTDNATKQDLAYQRYKDAFNVPYWSNKAIHDFLQKDILPIGGKKSKVDFDRRGNAYAKLMFEFEQDPNSETPEYDFYNKLKKDYNTKKFEDRFGNATLAQRFENKQNLAKRGDWGKVGGAVSQLLGVPYLNTLEQAKQAGAVSPEDWGSEELSSSPYTYAETAFDALTGVSPFKFMKASKAFVPPLAKGVALGAVAGAKGALEGEESATPEATAVKVAAGAGFGGGTGAGLYALSRRLPKYREGGVLDKVREGYKQDFEAKKQLLKSEDENVLKGLNEQISELKKKNLSTDAYARELEGVQNELDQYVQAQKAKDLRGEIFGAENMSGLQSYVDRFSGQKPLDIQSATPMERYDWASQRQLNEKMNSPLVYANADPYAYEVGGATPLESPLQNLRRPNVDTESPRAIFETATTYSPIGIADTPVMQERLTAAVNYFMSNPQYREALENMGIKNTQDFAKSEIGKQIYSEMINYLDEPIAKLAMTGERNPEVISAAYKEWAARNYPNGITGDAQNVFNEKLNIAKSGYRPNEYPTGKIENTQVYKDTKDIVKTYGDDKMMERLESVKEPNKTLEDVSRTIASIRNQLTGDVRTGANFAGELRTQMTPNVVLGGTFESVGKMTEAQKMAQNLFAKQMDLQKKISEAPTIKALNEAKTKELQNQIDLKKAQTQAKIDAEKANLDDNLLDIRLRKKGLSPAFTSISNLSSKASGYAIANKPLVQTDSDVDYLPYGKESTMFKTLNSIPVTIPLVGNITNPLYYWDSPLIKMRKAGSFKIPMQEKK